MICLAVSNTVCGHGCFLLCLQDTLSWGAGAWGVHGMALPVQGKQLRVLEGLAAAQAMSPLLCDL